jgi:hypothetical protein
VIFAIFCNRAFFVTFIGASFAIPSCWSSWLNPLIMTLQPSATRSSNASPGNAGLNLPTTVYYTRQRAFCPCHAVKGGLTLILRL